MPCAGGAPILSVLLRTQGIRTGTLHESLASLVSQDDSDFEVLLLGHTDVTDHLVRVQALVASQPPDLSARVQVIPVPGGGRARPLNVGLERASGSYIAFLDDDDLVTPDWVSTFREGAEKAPGCVIRSIAADQVVRRVEGGEPAGGYEICGEPTTPRPPIFDPIAHFADNQTPNCSVAVPAEAVRRLGIRFDETLPVMEDWDFLMRVALACGVFDTERVTSTYHRWAEGESSLNTVPRRVWHETRARIMEGLDRESLLLPPGSASRLALLGGLLAERAPIDAAIDQTLRDKDEMIVGLEASLAEYQAYVDTIIRDWTARVEAQGVAMGALQAELEVARQAAEVARPTVTVVVVNWNGERLLPACLDSLRAQTYPGARCQVVVVDNGSADGSLAMLTDRYPEVSVIDAGANLGFAGGNNLAIGEARSDYIALLNNDAVAEPGWLEALVAAAESDPAIAAVNSKILLLQDRLVVDVEVDATFVPGGSDERRLGAKVRVEARIGDGTQALEFTGGAWGVEHNDHGAFRWTTGAAQVRVPLVDSETGELWLRLVPAPHPSGAQPLARFRVGDEVVAEVPVPSEHPVEVRIAFTPGQARPVVQNAGSVVLPDGAGSDRGTMIVGGQPFSEIDAGQFDTVEDVPAFCGAASLLRRAALDQVGGFDGSFFMYYEDTDLSLRLRRAGWRIVFAPESAVRHHHAATSVEWSPMFCYYTERNRLLMLAKNGSPATAAREWARYTARIFRPGETSENRKRFLRVERSMARKLPAIVSTRWKARRRPGEGR